MHWRKWLGLSINGSRWLQLVHTTYVIVPYNFQQNNYIAKFFFSFLMFSSSLSPAHFFTPCALLFDFTLPYCADWLAHKYCLSQRRAFVLISRFLFWFSCTVSVQCVISLWPLSSVYSDGNAGQHGGYHVNWCVNN